MLSAVVLQESPAQMARLALMIQSTTVILIVVVLIVAVYAWLLVQKVCVVELLTFNVQRHRYVWILKEMTAARPVVVQIVVGSVCNLHRIGALD